MTFNRDLTSGAFEAALEAQKAETLEQLNQALRPAISSLGFQQFVGIEVVGVGAQRSVEVLHGEAHRSWQAHYSAREYGRRDSAIAKIVESAEPFFRSELADRCGRLSRLDAQIIAEARAFGVQDSLFFPQHHASGRVSGVVFITSEKLDRTPCMHTAAHLLAVQYELQTRRILRQQRSLKPTQSTQLTRRQIECLRLAALGKTSPEIARTLGLRSRTVDTYFASACERLGARNRAHAVGVAQDAGLLQ